MAPPLSRYHASGTYAFSDKIMITEESYKFAFYLKSLFPVDQPYSSIL
jgi:hypothetical protein